MNRAPQLDGSESAKLPPTDQIDLVCDAFEDAWSRGERPQIEDFLDRCDAPAKELLLAELLLVDREFRIKRGEIAGRQDYQQRFPGYSTIIDALEFATIDDRGRKGSFASRVQTTATAGSKLAHFELLEEIGSGASGTVWKARDTRLRRIVAVKMPRQERLAIPERERFLREGQACAQLRHPNIVAVHEVGEDHGRVFIVAEFIEGLNLRQWLDQRRPKPREAAELAAQLAEALHHAHEQGVIHRDLKPANVLIDSDGRPHVTDFGLAKWTTDSAGMTVEGNILGTPAYMSPEQARGDAVHVDRRSDVYGLGALLYEMLTGQPPFQGDVTAIVHQVIHDEPRPPRKINSAAPRDLETICLKAIEKSPNRRYPTAQEMAVDLRRFLRGEPIIARRINVLEKSWRWLHRRPAIAAAIVLPLIVLAAASAIIKSINDDNYRQQGYQRVQIRTNPSGARIAIVPIDKRTGEPNTHPGAVIRPSGKTPLTVYLQPNDYFIEAVIPGDGGALDIAEVYQTLSPPELLNRSLVQRNNFDGREERAREVEFEIEIKPAADVIPGMVAVPIDRELRRANPLLPALIYVDRNETSQRDLDTPPKNRDGDQFIDFETAKIAVAAKSRRLPSAVEYDAIVKAAADGQSKDFESGATATVEDLIDGMAEWTTTKYDFPGQASDRGNVGKLNGMRILKGYGDPRNLFGLLRSAEGYLIASPDSKSPIIGFRGVRTGRPRFVTPQ